MNPEELLLRDIHLPDPVSWWPPAIGWWLLAGLGIVLILAVAAGLRRRARARGSAAAIATHELRQLRGAWAGHGDAQRLVQDLSTWLRRAAMSLATREQAAGLTGERWHTFLDELAGAAVLADGGEHDVRLLAEGPYRRDVSMSRSDGERLLALSERWLRAAATRAGVRP